MSKVAHNLRRYLKLSVHLLHVIMFSGNIISVRDILHMQLEYLKHFFFYHSVIEQRKAESTKIRDKYPERIPVSKSL